MMNNAPKAALVGLCLLGLGIAAVELPLARAADPTAPAAAASTPADAVVPAPTATLALATGAPAEPVLPEYGPDGPPAELLDRARTARDCAVQAGLLDEKSTRLAVIDFTLPSHEERLWLIDEATGEILFEERVAHGKNTGVTRAKEFSDTPNSNQSSLGLYVGAEPYYGKHGYSLRLDGLEPGINGNARDRAIVVHGAEYATDAFVERHGRLGRSFGCPAVRPEISRPLIDELRHGTPLFAWHADSDWDEDSELSGCSQP